MIWEILILCACLIFITSAVLTLILCENPFSSPGLVSATRVFAAIAAGTAGITVALAVRALVLSYQK
jgi:hypothetical protein